MPTLVILIVVSIVLYFFYKVKAFRTKRVIERNWVNTKASIALGSFLLFFGINQIFLRYDSTVALVVSIIFILLGLANVILGYKMYRHYLPLAIEEAEQNQN
jgi:hypothetical protein